MSAEKARAELEPTTGFVGTEHAEVVAALAASGDDALSKADAEGSPPSEAVVEWSERALAAGRSAIPRSRTT